MITSLFHTTEQAFRDYLAVTRGIFTRFIREKTPA
jgi:hypothetical protein